MSRVETFKRKLKKFSKTMNTFKGLGKPEIFTIKKFMKKYKDIVDYDEDLFN